MAAEVRSFQVTIPAGTLQSAGFKSDLTMPARIVERLVVRVPPGPRGQMGFAIGAAGVAVLPYQAGQFIVTDNEIIDWLLENQISSGAWQLFGYNVGQYDHTVYIRFEVRPPQLAAVQSASPPIATVDLGPAPPPTTPPAPPDLGPPPPPLPLPPPVGVPALPPPAILPILTQLGPAFSGAFEMSYSLKLALVDLMYFSILGRGVGSQPEADQWAAQIGDHGENAWEVLQAIAHSQEAASSTNAAMATGILRTIVGQVQRLLQSAGIQ